MEYKTAVEWFEMLPDEVRNKAISNTDDVSKGWKYSTLKKALFQSFIWLETPEGGDFWVDIESGL